MTAPVGLTLLRAVLPDLPLTVGSVLPARVLSRDGERGTLMLAGVRLLAQLPADVAEGDVLRVRVQEAGGDKLLLKVVEQPQPQPAQQAAPAPGLTPMAPVALPGGATARLFVADEEEEGDGARGASQAPRMVFLRYDSPALGRMDIALTLTGAAIGAAVQLSAGEPARAARAGSTSLQGVLAAAAGRPALVQVLARDETVDLRA